MHVNRLAYVNRSQSVMMLSNFMVAIVTLFTFTAGSAIEDGGVKLNNVAHIENCTFMRNSAVEYGAAICLSSLLFLLDSSNVQPLTVTDW